MQSGLLLKDMRANCRAKRSCMATSQSVAIADRKPSAIPPPLFNACFALLVINICYFPVAYVSGMWIWENSGLGIPTDFVNVWAAGKLVLDGHPALAYDWDIQKQVELALLGQDFPGYFAWHYPPPFLFVASLLATLPYAVKLANLGFLEAINSDPGLKEGVNTYAGHCTYEAVATAQGLPYTPLDRLLQSTSSITA